MFQKSGGSMVNFRKLYEIEEEHRITVGELKERLQGYPDDTEITFGATRAAVPLVFFRVKTRGDDLVQIELNEVMENDF
jgi:hypothetical protein